MIPAASTAPRPNYACDADTNIGHAFGILMAYDGALQPWLPASVNQGIRLRSQNRQREKLKQATVKK